MAKLKKEQLTREMVMRAMKCENADELMALAKGEGFTLTKDEAEAYMDEFYDFDLDDEAMAKVAGGYGCDNTCTSYYPGSSRAS